MVPSYEGIVVRVRHTRSWSMVKVGQRRKMFGSVNSDLGVNRIDLKNMGGESRRQEMPRGC